jgi:hypothetical protein
MKTIFQVIIFGLISIMISCNEGTSDANKETSKTEQTQQDTAKFEQVGTKIVFATYQEATVYAGRTDYLFEDEIGGMLMIPFSNFDEIFPIELPENILESDEELEGLPGVNQELVGKKFKLSYNTDGAVFKIELAKK